MSRLMNPLWAIALIGYCAMIFWLSDQSRLPAPMLFDAQDKVMHAAAYAVMAGLVWQSFHVDGSVQQRVLAIGAVLFCSLYGASDEWHRSFVAGRDASLWDWLADTLGAMLLSGIRLNAGRKVRNEHT